MRNALNNKQNDRGDSNDAVDRESIPMIEAVWRLREMGLTVKEIAQAFARTGGPNAEDELVVARDILSRRRFQVCPKCGARQGGDVFATEAGCIFCAD